VIRRRRDPRKPTRIPLEHFPRHQPALSGTVRAARVHRTGPGGGIAESVDHCGIGTSCAAALEPTNIFAPVSTPAQSIFELSLLVLAVVGAIFVIVSGLLAYASVKFRKRKDDDGREPAQVYGSSQVELAWTITPVVIVLVLFLATARVIFSVQDLRARQAPLEVTVIGHHSGGSIGTRG